MQLKNFTIALLAVLVSAPAVAFAAPTLSVTRGGTFANNYLDANGNWVWNIRISNSDPVPTGSSPLAAELGFTASGKPTNETAALKGATNLSTGTNDDFYVLEPGAPIFGWEQLTNVGGQLKAIGLQSNCASGCTTTGSANQVFSSLSSLNSTTVGPHDYIQIVTRGPSAASGGAPSSTLTVSGAYGGKGRVSELDSSGAMVNYDTFSSVFTRTAVQGDANMNGRADDGDLNILLSNFQSSGTKWYQANFNNHGNNVTDDGDLAILLTNFNGTGTIGNGAGGSLSESNSIPEPTAAALCVLAAAGLASQIRHRRKSNRWSFV